MEPIGFLAATCVFFTFCMQSMIGLRAIGILSNILFIAYAAESHLIPILTLHCLLLPINCYSLTTLLTGRQLVLGSLNNWRGRMTPIGSAD
jgi:CRP/FNR family cyclic AMP-dependent transcriptional regulator